MSTNTKVIRDWGQITGIVAVFGRPVTINDAVNGGDAWLGINGSERGITNDGLRQQMQTDLLAAMQQDQGTTVQYATDGNLIGGEN